MSDIEAKAETEVKVESETGAEIKAESEGKTETEEDYDHLTQPPHVKVPRDHVLWPEIEKVMKEIYDPEIPVNIYELGLIYNVYIADEEAGACDVKVEMSLTSPACPVAQEMPGWVRDAILPIEGVGGVEVDVIWEPQWNPSLMAETAKMQLNMFM